VILETQKLINSDFDMLKKVGWLVYNRENQEAGLSKDELNELLQIVSDEEMEKEYQIAYNEGFNEGYE
jgi:hypothetical protein